MDGGIWVVIPLVLRFGVIDDQQFDIPCLAVTV